MTYDEGSVEEDLLARAETTGGELGVVVSPDAMEALGRLARAAAGEVHSDSELGLARESVDRLLRSAAEVQPEGRLRAIEEGEIRRPHVERALLSLCPGFWPFC